MIPKIKKLYRTLVNKNYTTLSGSISFFLLINGGATVFLILLIIESLGIHFDDYMGIITMPNEVSDFLTYFLNESNNLSRSHSIIFIFTSIWGASNLFYQLMQTGEFVFSEKHKISGLLQRAISIIAMVVFILLLILSLFFLMIVNFLLIRIDIGVLNVIWGNIGFFLIPFILLTFVNLYVPPIKVRMTGALIGGAFTAVFWWISSALFSLYVKYFSSLEQLYGALAFLIVFMMWIYLLTTGIIVGFIINYEYQKKERKETKKELIIIAG